MVLAPPPPSKRLPPPKASGLQALPSMVWSGLKFVLLPVIVLFVVLQLLTPSLRFSAKSAERTYKEAKSPTWEILTSHSGHRWQAQQVQIITRSNRIITASFIQPQQANSGAMQPLNIIVSNFVPIEWVLDRVRPQGNQTFLVYRSPREARMQQQGWHPLDRLRAANKAAHYWELIASNPLNQLYNIYMGLHEGPDDIVDLARWAITNIRSDSGRINLIGLGSGGLLAAAAANKLNAIGTPARTLTLVYPPADLDAAARDNLIYYPRWLRPAMAAVISPLYFRLSLERHLPRSYPTQKLLIIPRNSFDLATYAAAPAISWAGKNATVKYIDVEYAGFYDEITGTQIRDMVGKWLEEKQAINTY